MSNCLNFPRVNKMALGSGFNFPRHKKKKTFLAIILTSQGASMMVVLELMKPSWCPNRNAGIKLRATQDNPIELNADCNLRDLNNIYNLMITASRSNREKTVELPGKKPETG